MSNFYNMHEVRTARKAYQCTYCGEPVGSGQQYVHQTGMYDGKWHVNKTHSECLQEMCDASEGEFTAYSNERPCIEP